MTKTLIGTPDPEPDENAEFDEIVKRYKREHAEAVAHVRDALYAPLEWICKHKPK